MRREFEDAELRMLIDSVLFSKSLTQKQAKSLIDKLRALGNRYFTAKISHVCSLPDMQHADNKQMIYALDTINDAITEKKKIGFIYNDYKIDFKLHPRREKEYIVKLDRNIEIEDLNKALDGLYIDMPKPYKIKRYDLIPRTRNFIKVTLTEGKNREIRKIFSFLGYDVKSLTRIRIGCVELDDLETGEWRNLTQKEIKGLLSGKDNSKAVKPNKVRVVRPKREE